MTRTLDTPFKPELPDSVGEWQIRRKYLIEQIRVALALWPQQAKTVIPPVRIVDRIEQAGYSIENILIETWPRFYVGANFYLPRDTPHPHPAILIPHGHWPLGRLQDDPDVADTTPGDPPAAGRCSHLAIGANFARLGFGALLYDMVGYNDAGRMPHRIAIDAGDQLWGVNLMGFQTWNSRRVLDYLTSRPEVDSSRIGLTGASGGASQSLMLAAVDERIQAMVPVNMVSAHMQGGCICENAPGLRLDTNNVEIAALFAPKPMRIIAATGDWTCNTPVLEGPAIGKIYRLLGAEEKYDWVQFNYEHNYNLISRRAAYRWFQRWLQGIESDETVETPHRIESAEKLRSTKRNFSLKHPISPVRLKQSMKRAIGEGLPSPIGRGAPLDNRAKRLYRVAFQRLFAHHFETWMCELAIGRSSGLIHVWDGERFVGGNFEVGLIDRRSNQNSLVLVYPEGDLPQTLEATEIITSKRLQMPIGLCDTDKSEHDVFFTTYNRTQAIHRVTAITNAIEGFSRRIHHPVDLIGIGGTGALVLLAAAVASERVRSVTVDLEFFKARDEESYRDRLFVPGILRFGDLRMAALLLSPRSLHIYQCIPGEWRAVRKYYNDINCSDRLLLSPKPLTTTSVV